MLLYQRQHGTLPPAYTVGADGKPLHGWRVLLLPYLGQTALYSKLRLDEPWDSPHNRRFHDASLAVYRAVTPQLRPDQLLVLCENTAFQAGEGKSLDDLGMNLILSLSESRLSVGWADAVSLLDGSTSTCQTN
jgi:hypothetical protein